MKRPTLKQIKDVIQYLDEELQLEGSWDDVCEYIAHLKEDKYGELKIAGIQYKEPEVISVSNLLNKKCIRVEHYYRPLKMLNMAISKMAKEHKLFKQLRNDYREDPSKAGTTTLCIPLLKKHTYKNEFTTIFPRNFLPENQAEATEKATIKYSIYEIREAIAVATAFSNYIMKYCCNDN